MIECLSSQKSSLSTKKIIRDINKKVEQLVQTNGINKELASRFAYCNLINNLVCGELCR